MPLGNHLKIILRTLYFMCFRFELNDRIFVLIGRLVVCAVEPVSEQFCEQENEDQFRDPEPEGQDFPEGFEDGKFNPIL